MFDTLYSGEEVEIDIVQGEDFEQTWIFDEDTVPIKFITDGWSAKAAISDRTGKVWNEDMTVTLAVSVVLGVGKEIYDSMGHGTVEVSDAVATVAGGVVGALLMVWT